MNLQPLATSNVRAIVFTQGGPLFASIRPPSRHAKNRIQHKAISALNNFTTFKSDLRNK